MKERSLVAFTILAQMAVGAFWVQGVLHIWAVQQAGGAIVDAPAVAHPPTDRVLLAIAPLMGLGLLASFFHLGKPFDGWRALSNLRSSWLSREVLFALLFTGASGLYAGLQWFILGTALTRSLSAGVAALLGLSLIYSMANAYRLRTIPAWDTWITLVSFIITAFLLGGLAVGTMLLLAAGRPDELLRPSLQGIALSTIALLGAKLVLTQLWIARLATSRGAAAHAAAKITQEHGVVFWLHLALAAAGIAAAGVTLSPWGEGVHTGIAMTVAFGLVLASEVLGRLLFYEAGVRHGV